MARPCQDRGKKVQCLVCVLRVSVYMYLCVYMCVGCVCGVVNAEPLVIGNHVHMPLAAVIGSSLGQGHW